MSWFFIALIGPFLYALANHTDKYMIEKFLKGREVGALIIFSALFNVVFLPVSIIFRPDVLSIGLEGAIFLMVNGAITVLAVILYFFAMQRDEATYVVPFYQTVPVFGYALGYILLGEKLGSGELISSLLIIIGALIMSFELSGEKIRFKKAVVLLMLGASLLYAINAIAFKLLAFGEGDGFWLSSFWMYAGKALVGIGLFAFVGRYRRQFLELIKINRLKIIGINAGNEVATIGADSVSLFASLLAPVALVLTVNGFQPLFVFIFGILLSIFFPKIAEEKLDKKSMIQKCLGIGLIVLGSIILGFIGR